MDVVELGGIRLHLLTAYPGLPGEADRVLGVLRRLAPALVLADLDTDDALRLRAAIAQKKPYVGGFVDALFAEESQRRFDPQAKLPEHPLAAAARYARDRQAELVPLRPIGRRPGFFQRRRARKAVAAIAAKDPDAFAAAFERTLREGGVWTADADVAATRQRLVRALSGARAPVVAIVQPHRRAAFEDAVLSTGRIPA